MFEYYSEVLSRHLRGRGNGWTLATWNGRRVQLLAVAFPRID